MSDLDELVKLVTVSFYGDAASVIVDALIRELYSSEENLAKKLKLNRNIVRKNLSFMRDDGLLVSEERKEQKPDGLPNQMLTFQYWYIDYPHFVDVVRVKLHDVRKELFPDKVQKKEILSHCVLCNEAYADTDMFDLYDPEGGFKCGVCGGDIEAGEQKDTAEDAKIKEMFQTELKPIFDALKKVENMVMKSSKALYFEQEKIEAVKKEEASAMGSGVTTLGGKGHRSGPGATQELSYHVTLTNDDNPQEQFKATPMHFKGSVTRQREQGDSVDPTTAVDEFQDEPASTYDQNVANEYIEQQTQRMKEEEDQRDFENAASAMGVNADAMNVDNDEAGVEGLDTNVNIAEEFARTDSLMMETADADAEPHFEVNGEMFSASQIENEGLYDNMTDEEREIYVHWLDEQGLTQW
eukprot:GFYU01013227.1.p1 GENE.GFYU01013227.1~~GFYU01013227.1.p1  ORF type:complete len:411 (-),score=109.65 GFYU01013227.1:157-1389(-)